MPCFSCPAWVALLLLGSAVVMAHLPVCLPARSGCLWIRRAPFASQTGSLDDSSVGQGRCDKMKDLKQCISMENWINWRIHVHTPITISKVTLKQHHKSLCLFSAVLWFKTCLHPAGSIEAKSPETPISRAECYIITHWHRFRKGCSLTQSHLYRSWDRSQHPHVSLCRSMETDQSFRGWPGLCALLCGVDLPDERLLKPLLKICAFGMKILCRLAKSQVDQLVLFLVPML